MEKLTHLGPLVSRQPTQTMNDLPSSQEVANPAHLRRARKLSALVLLIGAFSVGAVAQTAPAEKSAPAPAAKKDDVLKLEAFITTGTRFNDRTVIESSVPIDVVSGADLRSGGYTETNQMLQAVLPSYNFPRPTVADGTDHIPRPRCAASRRTRPSCSSTANADTPARWSM